jgi:hypothetical protein
MTLKKIEILLNLTIKSIYYSKLSKFKTNTTITNYYQNVQTYS